MAKVGTNLQKCGKCKNLKIRGYPCPTCTAQPKPIKKEKAA